MKKHKGMETLLEKVVAALEKGIEERVPEQGKFERLGVQFRYPNTEIVGNLGIEVDLLKEGSRRLTARAFQPGDGRQVMNYLEKGTKQELLVYLSSERAVPELVKIFLNLKEGVEDLD